MASFTLTSLSTIGRTLNSGEIGYIGREGALVTGNTISVTLNALASLVVDGAAIARTTAIQMQERSWVTVSAGATVSGSVGVDLSGTDGIKHLANDGFISGTSSGVAFTGWSNGAGVYQTKVSNTGTIIGHDVSGVWLYAFDGLPAILQNAGAIQGGLRGVTLNRIGVGDEEARVENSGTISGGTFGILGDGERDVILNSGTISTAGDDSAFTPFALALGLGDDRVVNSGLITGNVDMGADDDVFINRSGGEVTGSVAGGAGNDTLKGGDHEDDFAGGGGDDDLRGKNGDDTLDGGANDDDLRGGQGEDVLIGGGGGDKLRGGRDDDTLIGGTSLAGDKFIFNRKAGDDQILDFENGRDLIVLNAFGLRPADYASVLAPALSNAGNGATLLDLDALGGQGSVLIEGLKFSQADASDFLL